jgi:molybdopterin synthase catalytic subunit
MIDVTEKPIDVPRVLASVETEKAGGVVHFLGTVRKEKGLTGLFYEGYPEMAVAVLRAIADEARRRWPVERVAVVHRVGWVGLGEPAVVVAVSSAHRAEAFEACRYVIDTLKREAPIWKMEYCEEEKGFKHAENC